MPTPIEAQTAEAAAADAYLDSSDSLGGSPARGAFDRRLLRFAAIGLGVYLLTLLVTIPAQLVVPLPGAGGTIWRGSAPIAGGSLLTWRWAPLRSLIRFGFAADIALDGPASALAGQALLRPGRVLLDDVRGTADGGLLALAGPSFACATQLRVDLDHLAIGGGRQGAQGRIRAEPGSCRTFGSMTATAIPATILDIRQTPGLAVFNLAAAGALHTPLMMGGLGDKGQLQLIVTREGAAIFPFASTPGGMKIETEL